jgi:hypothetical protein
LVILPVTYGDRFISIFLNDHPSPIVPSPIIQKSEQGPYRSPSLSYVRSNGAYRAIPPTAFVLVFFFLAGWMEAVRASGQSLQSDSGQSTVQGTVVNAVTREPIGRALVYSPDNRFAMLTDGEGHFEFTLPDGESGSGDGFPESQARPIRSPGSAGGPSWLMARKPGFLDDPNGRRQILASPGSDLTISLIPEALIKGRVTVSASDAAVGLSVQIFSQQVLEGVPRWMPGPTVRTDSNGEFRFAELLPRPYKLVTHELMDNDPALTVPGGQAYGFAPVYYPGASDFAAAGTIQLAAGQIFQADLSVVRQPYYTVRIPVVNGGQYAGMNITVSPQGHLGPGYMLSYKTDKQRIEGLLPNGNYLVGAVTRGATGGVNLAVADAPVDGPSMALIRNGSISVNVREEFTSNDNSASRPGSEGTHTTSLHGPRAYLDVRVEAVDDFGPQRSAGLRQPSGPNDDSLEIDDLAPGPYWLRVRSSRGYVATASMAGIDLLHEPLAVGSGVTTPVEITMRDDTAEIAGTVAGITATPSSASGPASSPYPGASANPAYVYCVPLPDSPGQFQQLSVSSDGKFDSKMMAPGTYRAMAFKNPQSGLPYRDPEAMRAYEAKGQIIQLAAGQKENIQLQLISGSD